MVLAHLPTAVVGRFWLICQQQWLGDFGSSANSSGWEILAHLPTAVVGRF